MLTGVHFLLTYRCNYQCDHCFLYCSPETGGTFTLAQVKAVLEEARKIGTVDWIYFEGGEPMLYYPLLLESVRAATDMGFKVGVVTNGFFGTCQEDAALWLRPFVDLNVADLSMSDDVFHSGEDDDESPARIARRAAEALGAVVATICIEAPTVESATEDGRSKGQPVVGGGAMFRGRAADTLTEGLPRRHWKEMTACPHEELEKPERVHVDAFGNVHICQGVSMGNLWETPLAELVRTYDAASHPICGPLTRGGPALLAAEYDVPHEESYVDECHLCFLTRRALLDRFPEHLAPRQVYGLGEE